MQKQPPEVFYKKSVPKNFPIFTGKHLCWSLFLIKLQAWRIFANSYFCHQKHPSRGFLVKRCSENMQKIYRKIPMPKCDFNKVAKQFRRACSVKLLYIFRIPFYKNTSWGLLRNLNKIILRNNDYTNNIFSQIINYNFLYVD